MELKELEEIIIYHSKRYPLMEIEDLIKLIYQFTYGPNHLFNQDINKIKQQVILEGSNSKNFIKEAIYIGNDLYRVSLTNDLDYLGKVFDCFIKTAKENFNLDKEALKKAFKETKNFLGYFKNINKEEFIAFTNNYLKGDIYPISHSKTYKDFYHPSYRLVHKKYLDLLEIELS